MTHRLLALAVVAGAVAVAAPAGATCAGPARAGVCATVMDCRGCPGHVAVDPYCNPVQPVSGICTTVHDLKIDSESR